MRLLHTTDLQLQQFIDAEHAPPYAILSHRWGDDEVSFKEYRKGLSKDGKGYLKIVNACKFARSRNLEYLWIDTCCIDQRSSAEHSEAINSMFDWYRGSRECYAYLADVEMIQGSRQMGDALKRSEWFTRGWTLQELVAPRYVMFLAKDWNVIGYKGSVPRRELSPSLNLHRELNAVTRIPIDILSTRNSIRSASIAQRMSWMSSRITTRREDMAYCLLGIFDVNMPLLYGEGWKAFERLQLEILARNSDESIFAWNPDNIASTRSPHAGILAPSPSLFEASDSIVPAKHHDRPPNALTNRGLQVYLQGSHVYFRKDDPGWIYLVMNCTGSAQMLLQDPSLDGYIVVFSRSICGHYNRVSRPPVNPVGWSLLEKEDVIYVHLTERESLSCRERLNAELPPLPPALPIA